MNTQARSQDFQTGGLHECLMCMYVCMHKHAELGGSGGMLPQEKLDALHEIASETMHFSTEADP